MNITKSSTGWIWPYPLASTLCWGSRVSGWRRHTFFEAFFFQVVQGTEWGGSLVAFSGREERRLNNFLLFRRRFRHWGAVRRPPDGAAADSALHRGEGRRRRRRGPGRVDGGAAARSVAGRRFGGLGRGVVALLDRVVDRLVFRVFAGADRRRDARGRQHETSAHLRLPLSGVVGPVPLYHAHQFVKGKRHEKIHHIRPQHPWRRARFAAFPLIIIFLPPSFNHSLHWCFLYFTLLGGSSFSLF